MTTPEHRAALSAALDRAIERALTAWALHDDLDDALTELGEAHEALELAR